MGIGDDEDEWTWEGIRDTIRLYYSTSKVDLPTSPCKASHGNQCDKSIQEHTGKGSSKEHDQK